MVHIFANTIPLPEYKQPWEEAVLKGIGNRLASENWSVSILAPADSGDYFVHVERPDLPDCPKIVIQFLRPIELDLVESRTRDKVVEFASSLSSSLAEQAKIRIVENFLRDLPTDCPRCGFPLQVRDDGGDFGGGHSYTLICRRENTYESVTLHRQNKV